MKQKFTVKERVSITVNFEIEATSIREAFNLIKNKNIVLFPGKYDIGSRVLLDLQLK